MDLSNYATKAGLKVATAIDTSTLATKADFTSLKMRVNNLDVGKLKTVPADFSKLISVVDDDMMMLSKKLHMINWVPMSMLLTVKYQALVD